MVPKPAGTLRRLSGRFAYMFIITYYLLNFFFFCFFFPPFFFLYHKKCALSFVNTLRSVRSKVQSYVRFDCKTH